MKKSLLFVLSAVLLIAMLAAGCNGNGGTTTSTTTGGTTTGGTTTGGTTTGGTTAGGTTTTTTSTGGNKVLGDTAGKLPAGHAGYFAAPMCYACHMPGTGADEYPMAPVWAGSLANPGPWTVTEGSPGDHTGRTSDANCITCHKMS